MFKKLLVGLAPALAVAALVAMPALSQAAPQFFMNGKKAGTKHELAISVGSFGRITLHNGVLPNTECETLLSDRFWNEVREGTERGFEETTGYATWECKSLACEVTNERGVKKNGPFCQPKDPPTCTRKKLGATATPASHGKEN